MKIYKLYILLVLVTASCSKYDTYAPPDARIYGVVNDQITNEPIQTEQPNGIRIRMIDEKPEYKGVAQPTYFWVKADGTFNNSKVFSGPYDVTPVDGPFYPLEAGTKIDVMGATQIAFTVEPFLSITAKATSVKDGVSVTYKLTRGRVGSKISEARLLVASVPYVSTSIFDVIDGANKVAVRNLTAVPDETILATDYTDEIKGLLSGKTYFVRIAARTATNINNKYNYSKVMEVKIP